MEGTLTDYGDGRFSRRVFLRNAALAVAAGAAASTSPAAPLVAAQRFEARHYEKLPKDLVRCGLCPWRCVVRPGARGRCGVRENRNGRYYTLVYGKPVALNNDPIEKKPFFHVYPASKSLSIATVGCNMHCKFCQNWDISQTLPEKVHPPFRPPDEIVKLAQRYGSKTIAYTYSEPTIFFEYMMDCAAVAKEAGIGNVMVSNGFISKRPLAELCEVMTAVKVDFKAFSQQFYADVCEGLMEPVKSTLKRLAESGVWFEIVVLIIPTLNDGKDEIKRMAAWIAAELGPDVPLHFTRFHPSYKMKNLPPTPPRTLAMARATAMAEGCRFVYTGNMPGGKGESTYCPSCGERVIDRYGFTIMKNRLKKGACPKCKTPIPGVW